MTGRAGAVELEVRTEIVELLNVTRGETVDGVRVEFRPVGERRWRHVNLIPDPGQTLEALVKHAHLAAQMVHAGGTAELVDDVDQEP